MKSRRQFIQPIAAMAMLSPLLGCAAGGAKEKKMVELSYVKYNYTDRVIFDIFLNGHGGGVAPAYGGGNSVSLFTTFELGGPQTLTWRDAGTGDTFTAKNPLFIREEDIPKSEKHASQIAIHIYPDQTAELTFAIGTPPPTPRGAAILKEHGE